MPVRHDEVFKIGELAEYLKVSKSTLYKLVEAGRLPGQKVGKHWRFHKDVVDAWLKERPTQRANVKRGRADKGADADGREKA